ncbi:hypothetical protein B0J14DRAFT_174776 [Halenospora varia]|nr:hypothetical protein B0J14DRAFT_174776 [Halenospora varia]
MMKVNRSLPKSDKPDQEQTIEWSKLNLELADFCNSTSNRPENIVGNFFRLKLDRHLSIRRYQIALPDVKDRPVKKREVRKALTKNLLETYPPSHQNWVCDYYSHIVSVGKLYNQFMDSDGEAWSMPHSRTQRDGEED